MRVHDPSGVSTHGVALWSAGHSRFRSARVVMALSDVAIPSSGEVWSWDCGSESVSGHPTSATSSSHVRCVTNLGPDWRPLSATLCCRRSQAVQNYMSYPPTARHRAAKARTAGANERAAKLSPIVKDIQAAGITSLSGIAEALNKRRVPTPRDRGRWPASQVQRPLARLKV
jgi:hypothetical protein